MLFQLGINLTEEDYLAFYTFDRIESPHGKKQLKLHRRNSIILLFFFLVVFSFASRQLDKIIVYAVLLGVYACIYMLLYKKLCKRNIARSVKKSIKAGKLNIGSASAYEFYEDRIVELDRFTRDEMEYAAISQVYVLKDRYILLEKNNSSVYIFPIQQIKAQINQDEFLRFISQKCNNIKHY